MRKIKIEEIRETVKKLALKSNFRIRPDVERALRKIYPEASGLGKWALEQILENLRIAEKEKIPLCQDTGFVVVFVELGEEVRIVACPPKLQRRRGGNLYQAINQGVVQAYQEGYFRDSVVSDPVRRGNYQKLKTEEGKRPPTPRLRRAGITEIHLEIVPGDKLTIHLIPKGAGSENNSAVGMLLPTAGKEGVKKFILETVKKGAGNSCPPIVVGVGIGGNLETCALLAKKALLRRLGSEHKDSYYAKLEKELLKEINALGIGVQGLGGRVTALAVFIETHPCHIASLPVAVNIQCNAYRHETAVI